MYLWSVVWQFSMTMMKATRRHERTGQVTEWKTDGEKQRMVQDKKIVVPRSRPLMRIHDKCYACVERRISQENLRELSVNEPRDF